MKARRLVWTAVFALALAVPCAALNVSNAYRSPRNPERRLRTATRLIVLHTTEAHARSSLNKLQERGECHYCMTEDGTAYRIVDRDRVAFHAGRSMWNGREDCDDYSIGIEVVGYHDKPITAQQAQALRELLDKLKKAYGIPDGSVVCHSHVAYGAPNRWHRQKHRGRKQCGMLFAMPSVRRKLGLTARPALDPDQRAGRLVQGDPQLQQILYGKVDTMVGRIGTAPAAKSSGGLLSGLRNWFGGAKPVDASATKTTEAKKDRLDKKGGKTKKDSVAKKDVPRPAVQTREKLSISAAPPDKTSTFKKGELVRMDKSEDSVDSVTGHAFHKGTLVSGITGKPMTDKSKSAATPSASTMTPPANLDVLRTLPGYVQGGPLGPNQTPYKIAGKAWNDPGTYYYTRGKVVRGDKVDLSTLERGALVFYRKKP